MGEDHDSIIPLEFRESGPIPLIPSKKMPELPKAIGPNITP